MLAIPHVVPFAALIYVSFFLFFVDARLICSFMASATALYNCIVLLHLPRVGCGNVLTRVCVLVCLLAELLKKLCTDVVDIVDRFRI